MLRSDFAPSPGIGDGSLMVARAELYRGDSERALLLFGEFRNTGVPITVPAEFSVHGLSAGLLEQFSEAKAPGEPQIWQFQMFVPHTEELDSATRSFWTQTYLEFFREVLDRWSSRA